MYANSNMMADLFENLLLLMFYDVCAVGSEVENIWAFTPQKKQPERQPQMTFIAP